MIQETAGISRGELVSQPIFYAQSYEMRFANWQTRHFLSNRSKSIASTCLDHGLSISMLFSLLISIHVLNPYFIATPLLVAMAVWQAFGISGGVMDPVMLNGEQCWHGMDTGMMAVSVALGILASAVCEGIGMPGWIH